MSSVAQLKKILTYSKLINSINENKFKQYVDEVRKFKIDNKIDGKLRDTIPTDSKSTDLKALANKFDIFIPVSNIIDEARITIALNQLKAVKKVAEKINSNVKFPTADDLIEPDSSVGGGTRGMEREMKLKPMEEKVKSSAVAKTKVRPTAEQEELMKGTKRMKEKLSDDVQEEGEPKLTEKEKEDIAKSIVDEKELDKLSENLVKDAIENAIDDLEEEGKITERSKKIKEMLDNGLSEKEANEMLDKLEAEVGTQIGREMMMGQLEPPATAEEEMKEGQEAVKKAKEQRPEIGMSAEEEAELLDVNPNLADVPSESTSVQDMKPSKGMELKVSKRRKTGVDIPALPTKAELIPKERLSTRGKDIKELLNDINYFLSNFKSQLKKEKDFYSKVDKKNINQLRELHARIVGKLQPNLPAIEKDKKVGVVINADEYIREQMKRILNESTFSNLRPSDVVIDVGNRKAEGRDTADYGDFEVKKTLDGGLAVQREAVYRYMPSENDDMVNEEDQTQRQRKKPNRLALPKSRLNNERTNAIRQTVNNPFRRPQKTVKLKYLY